MSRKPGAIHGVATEIHYPIPDHQQVAYPQSLIAGSMAVTNSSCQKLLTLPCFPGMTDEAVESVIAAVKKYFEQ